MPERFPQMAPGIPDNPDRTSKVLGLQQKLARMKRSGDRLDRGRTFSRKMNAYSAHRARFPIALECPYRRPAGGYGLWQAIAAIPELYTPGCMSRCAGSPKQRSSLTAG